MFFVTGGDTGQNTAEKAKDVVTDGVQAAGQELNVFTRIFTFDKLGDYATVFIRITLMFFILFIIWAGLRKLIRTIVKRQTLTTDDVRQAQFKTAGHMLESLLGYVMIGFAVMGVLSIVGFDMRGLVTSAGIAGVFIAFVSQNIIKDWISGLLILFERQHNVGDWVRIGTHEGEVITLKMRSTVIRTWRGETIYIPNGSVGEIINYSKTPQRGVIDVAMDYGEDPAKVEKVLWRVAYQINANYSDDLIEEVSLVGIVDFVPSAVLWRLTFTARDLAHFTISRQLRRTVLDECRRADIEIPRPQLTIYNKEEKACP